MSENDLIAGCLKNDRKMQRALYDRYKNAMYSLCYRLTGNFEDASDALQDAFMEVFRSLGNYRGDSSLGAWIKTIVTRKAVRKFNGHIRFESYENVPEEPWPELESDVDLEMLEIALMSLPEGFRTILVLYEIEGYTHKEISAMLRISTGTSKSQLFHARKRLKEMITDLQ